MTTTGLDIIYAAIDELNALSEDGVEISKSPDTKILSGDDGLDSLDLVNLVVAIEHHIEEATGDTVVLVNESTMALENNPFQSVATLAAHLEGLLAAN